MNGEQHGQVVLDLDAIEKRAGMATGDRWEAFSQRDPAQPSRRRIGIVDRDVDDYGDVVIISGFDVSEADAEHIAGMDPEMTVALVAEVRRLRKVRALPDREAIADIVQEHQFRSMALEGASLPRCRCGIELPAPSRMAHADHLTDVLLALFGQEGQR